MSETQQNRFLTFHSLFLIFSCLAVFAAGAFFAGRIGVPIGTSPSNFASAPWWAEIPLGLKVIIWGGSWILAGTMRHDCRGDRFVRQLLILLPVFHCGMLSEAANEVSRLNRGAEWWFGSVPAGWQVIGVFLLAGLAAVAYRCRQIELRSGIRL